MGRQHLATTVPLVPRCPPLAAWSEELWPGCLADSHCHLDLVLRCLARRRYTKRINVSSSNLQPAPRRLREATGDLTLSSLEDSLARWVLNSLLVSVGLRLTPRQGRPGGAGRLPGARGHQPLLP